MVGTNAIRRFAGRKVYRFGLAFALFALPLTACSTGADAANSAQVLVDRSTLTVETMLGSGAEGNQASQFLRRAKAVVVCPRIFKAGFFIGGEGGDCVLASRAANGSWSDPAFYSMGGGQFRASNWCTGC